MHMWGQAAPDTTPRWSTTHEYGIMQAYAEGFEILKASQYPFAMPQLPALEPGSVIRSWLLELTQAAFERDPRAARIKGWVEDSGEGRWTLQERSTTRSGAVHRSSLLSGFARAMRTRLPPRCSPPCGMEFGGHPIKPGIRRLPWPSAVLERNPLRERIGAGPHPGSVGDGHLRGDRRSDAPQTDCRRSTTWRSTTTCRRGSSGGRGPTRRSLTTSFRSQMRDAVGKYSRTQPIDSEVWRSFSERLHYVSMAFEDRSGYARISAVLEK